MKVRHGFVSNSSSSSFVIAVKEIPSIHELCDNLWGKDGPYGHIEMAAHIRYDLEKAVPLTDAEVCEEFSGGYIYDPENPLDEPRSPNMDWEEISRRCDEFTDKKAREFMDKFPNHKFLSISYADDDGARQGQLEHDTPWHNWENVFVISHH